MDEVREKLEKLVARTSSSLGSRIDRVRKDGAQNKDDIAAVRFEVSRAKANSRRDRVEKCSPQDFNTFIHSRNHPLNDVTL